MRVIFLFVPQTPSKGNFMKSFITVSLIAVCTLASTAFAQGGACDPDKLKEKNQTYQECSDEFFKKLGPNQKMSRTDLISKQDSDTLPGRYFVDLTFDKATEKKVSELRKQIAKRFGLAKDDFVHFTLSESSPLKINRNDYLVSQSVEGGWMSEHPLQSRTKIEAYKEALSYKGQTAVIQVTAAVHCYTEDLALVLRSNKVCTPTMNAVNNGEIYEITAKVTVANTVSFKVENWWVADQVRTSGIDDKNLFRERGDQYICLNQIEDRSRHCNEKNLSKLIKR